MEIACKGMVSGQDIENAKAIIYRKVNPSRRRYQFFDLTEVSQFDVTLHDVKRIGEQDIEASKKYSEMVIAIVADNDVARAIANMWNVYVGKARFEKGVFRNEATARAWIGEKLNEKSVIR